MKRLLGSDVAVIIDRPLGSRHPNYPDLEYKLNYGYVPGIKSPDGEDVDAYVMDIDYPIPEYSGKVIAVIHRKDDIEDKLVVSPSGIDYTREDIVAATDFVERYFDITVEMLN